MTRRTARSLPILILAGLLLGAGPALAQQKRIYIANDDHTDFMWTADVETYRRVFVDLLDFNARLADETANEPGPYRSRYNVDGSYWLWAYERAKSPAEFDRLMGRVRDGQLGVPLNTLVSCYGGQPAEAVLRGMYYAGRLERRYGVRFPIAESMENQAQPLGLASLWAGAGAKWSWKGVCACASKIPTSVLNRRNREIYWYAGQDGQRVLMKWYSVGPHNMGTYLEADKPEKAIDYLTSDAGFLGRYKDPATGKPYDVLGAFGFGGDTLARKTGVPADPGVPGEPGVKAVIGWAASDHFHEIARRASNDKRQVIVSNEADFFQDFEATHGATLPAEDVTHGNEWDLYSASMAETSSRVKRAVEKLRAAELMAALVALKRPDFARTREKGRDLAFTDLGLYWEHDWTADGPVSRPARAAWQNLLAAEVDAYVDTLHADAAIRLGGLIPRAGTAPRFFVLNPLGWPRDDFADFPYRGPANVHVRDVAAGRDVPHQVVNLDGATSLRILASDVPPAGYKTFEILAGPGTAPGDPAATVGDGGTSLENARVRLVVEPDGAIASLVDKARGGRELAGEVGGLRLNDLAAGDLGAAPAVENAGPVSVSLRCESKAGLDHVTTITLFRGSDRVDVRNRIRANFSDVRHWGFSFNLDAPDVRTEEVGAIIRDKLRSQGGDYADTHARYDYVTLNHFADIADGAGDRGVTLSNRDCSFAKLGRSTPEVLDSATPQINVLAGGQVDGSGLGIPSQGGATDFLHRFALRPHGAYDPAAAMRFALEHQNPLVAAPVLGNESSPYPASAYSLLTVSNPDVLLWALKPAEEGIDAGVIARVWNVAPTPGDYAIRFAPGLASARRATHIETDLGPLPVSDGRVASPIAASQIQTLRLIRPPG